MNAWVQLAISKKSSTMRVGLGRVELVSTRVPRGVLQSSVALTVAVLHGDKDILMRPDLHARLRQVSAISSNSLRRSVFQSVAAGG